MKDSALVTGSNSGIGAAVAEELAGAGYTVLLNYYRNQEAAEALEQKIMASGGNAERTPFDVTDREATEQTIAGWIADELRICVVVNACRKISSLNQLDRR